MRGHRVVSQTERRQILKELHTGHFGMVKMKGLARRHCWWPGIDQDIERLVASFEECIKTRNNPPKVETHVWEPAKYPFERNKFRWAIHEQKFSSYSRRVHEVANSAHITRYNSYVYDQEM